MSVASFELRSEIVLYQVSKSANVALVYPPLVFLYIVYGTAG